jgi:hypothetical protein
MGTEDFSGQWRRQGGEGDGGGRVVEGCSSGIGRWEHQGRRWPQQGGQWICGPPLSLTSHLLTFAFNFSDHLKRRAKKRSLKKNGPLFQHFDLQLTNFYFQLSKHLNLAWCAKIGWLNRNQQLAFWREPKMDEKLLALFNKLKLHPTQRCNCLPLIFVPVPFWYLKQWGWQNFETFLPGTKVTSNQSHS